MANAVLFSSTACKATPGKHGLARSPKRERAFKRPRETSSSSNLGIRKPFCRRSSSQDGRDAKPAEVFWPLDLLPDDCPNARILTWGYDSRVTNFFGGSENQSNVFAHARNLVHALRRLRLECAICRAANDDTLRDVYTSTAAVFFLGTPHRGSPKAALGEIARRIVFLSGVDTSDQNLRALRVDSAELEVVHESFVRLYELKDRRFQVVTFQEAKGY
ncbi:hypothetical protein LZ554_000735 [Drepanopeziza brunnea f. sp. 'monogermtubi']|nr:hypothetical protein LZ554_000735 [Drepanopeziza brunnea f. sp. 'monogermtubi']